jgi:arylsulfatase A-like enzyme
MYEPSVRVPAIVWAPGVVRADQRLDGFTSHMDLGPTVLELAGLEPPKWMEAQSLLSGLRGETWVGREQVFSEHAKDAILTGTELMTMVRDESMKLVEFIDTDEGQLFDLVADPGEVANLWDDASYAVEKARMLHVISRWRAQCALDSASWSAVSR